jgi:hypothetical protein
MRQSGSVIGVALFGSLLAGNFISGLHLSLLISLGVLGAGVVAGLEIGTRSRRVGGARAAEGH